MRTEVVKNSEGKDVTLWYPENDADIDLLNEKLKQGQVSPPPSEERTPVVE